MRNLITDVSGVLVGNAEDGRVNTGATVIRTPGRATGGVFVGGGGPGTRETDLLAAENLVDAVDAIVLSGGSVYGLAAGDGVVAALGAQRAGFVVSDRAEVPTAPIVPAAILFDLANGGDKAWGEAPPYRDLGTRALAAAGPDFTLGRAGAGFGARAGSGPGGLGSASARVDDLGVVGAIVAVNSIGAVRQPGTRAFWAWPYEQAAEFGGARPWDDGPPPPVEAADWGEAKLAPAIRANTTIAVVAVEAALTPAEAKRLAVMASAGLARAIRPIFTPYDGDVVFALSTATRPPTAAPLDLARLGAAAADVLARAVARGVWEAERADASAR